MARKEVNLRLRPKNSYSVLPEKLLLPGIHSGWVAQTLGTILSAVKLDILPFSEKTTHICTIGLKTAVGEKFLLKNIELNSAAFNS